MGAIYFKMIGDWLKLFYNKVKKIRGKKAFKKDFKFSEIHFFCIAFELVVLMIIYLFIIDFCFFEL